MALLLAFAAGYKLKDILSSNEISTSDVSEEEIAKNEGIIRKNKYYSMNWNSKLNMEILARALDIKWGSNPRHWIYMEEQFKFKTIEVARLPSVSWLNVKGCQDTKILSPDTEYEVLFDIKLGPYAYGWCEPVNFSLTTPDGREKKCQLKLDQYVAKGYVDVPIGKFTNSKHGSNDNIKFSMYKEDVGHVYTGLFVRGVIIRALN